jgi:hypothetical protein
MSEDLVTVTISGPLVTDAASGGRISPALPTNGVTLAGKSMGVSACKELALSYSNFQIYQFPRATT